MAFSALAPLPGCAPVPSEAPNFAASARNPPPYGVPAAPPPGISAGAYGGMPVPSYGGHYNPTTGLYSGGE